MIKRAIALAFCLLLLCSCIASAATNNSITDSKNIININKNTNNSIDSESKASINNTISVSESTANSQNNSSSSSVKYEEADNGNFLTNAVSAGITLFIKGICDGIYADIYADGHGTGENSTGSVNGTEYTNSTDSLYDALTSVPHPYENQTIVKMYGGYLNITIYCIVIFVLGALIGRSIARMRLDKNIDVRQAAFIGGIAICGLALISNIIYMYALDVVEALNHYIVLPAMPAMTPDPTDDLLISIIQSFCDFLLLVFFNIRYYMLNVVAVGCSIVAVLLVPEFTRDFAEDCIEKIIRILLLQPAALFVYVVCILSAPSFPDGFKAVSHISTTVLVFATCWYFMFGNFTLLKKGVSFVIRKGVAKV